MHCSLAIQSSPSSVSHIITRHRSPVLFPGFHCKFRLVCFPPLCRVLLDAISGYSRPTFHVTSVSQI